MLEITKTPLVKILTTQLGTRVVMKGDDYVYLSDSTVVDDDEITTAIATQTTYYNQATYKATYTQALEDLASADVQITYHNESSSRAVATIYDWYAYKEALRDIASKEDDVYRVNDISDNTYTYTVDGVKTDYTCSLDDDGYPIAPSTES